MELAIILMQTVFAVLLMGVVWESFNLLQHDIANTLVARLVEQSQANVPLSAESANDILQSLEGVRVRGLIAILATIVLTTAFFAYALARFALIPTRNTLRSQKQFVGNIAHELRTPLSIIKTDTEVALLGEVDPESKRVFTGTLEELDRISNIINNLLSLSAFTRPEKIEFGALDMAAVAKKSVSALSRLAEKKGVTLGFSQKPPTSAWGNAAALEQVAMNLIKNAVNYTPRGGRVEVSVAGETGGVRLTVVDTGIGIGQSDLSRIFEPFYRAEASRSRTTGSSGLGLAIVSELVELHAGSIAINSTVGRGTTVSVFLPSQKKGAHGAKSVSRASGGIEIDFS